MSAQPAAEPAPWNYSRLLTWTTDFLTRQGIEDARLSSELLLAHAVGCRRIELYTRGDQVPAPEHLERFREWVKRAAAHEPIAYLVGEKEFFSLAYRVSREVLIPRAETEILVEWALDYLARTATAAPKLLDIGTGSGCLAITLLKHCPTASAVATDVSAAALEIARANAERHGVLDRMVLVQADRLQLPSDVRPDGGFDLLVCNPPYIPESQVPMLDVAVRDYEPRAALTDGGDGLSFYRELAAGSRTLLNGAGVVVVEVADGQADAVREIFNAGGWTHRITRRDRTTGRQRVLAFGG